MLICCQLPGGYAWPGGVPATITRPSAGASTASVSVVIGRSGSRKKKRNEPVRTRKRIAPPRPMKNSASAARTSEPPINGHPAGSIRMNAMVRECPVRGSGAGRVGAGFFERPAPRIFLRHAAVLARVLPDDGFHLVLERELLLLQSDLFELFCG